MITLWVSQENIFDCDDSGMCAFQLSYQHKEVYNIINQHVTFEQREYFDSEYSKPMNEWYDRVENCKTLYGPAAKKNIECTDSVKFLANSIN